MNKLKKKQKGNKLEPSSAMLSINITDFVDNLVQVQRKSLISIRVKIKDTRTKEIPYLRRPFLTKKTFKIVITIVLRRTRFLPTDIKKSK